MHASVYKCWKKEDTQKAHPYAVKFSRESDEEKRELIVKEFYITKDLDHNNVVRTVELFNNELKGQIHIVMELVNGCEVLEEIANEFKDGYCEDDAKALFRQILEGIAYLHEQHVAHRDIKPANLIVTKDRRIVILDFNVSH